MSQSLFALLGLGTVAWAICVSGKEGGALAFVISFVLFLGFVGELYTNGFSDNAKMSLVLTFCFTVLGIIQIQK